MQTLIWDSPSLDMSGETGGAVQKENLIFLTHAMPDVQEQLTIVVGILILLRSARESIQKSKQLSTADFWGLQN